MVAGPDSRAGYVAGSHLGVNPTVYTGPTICSGWAKRPYSAVRVLEKPSLPSPAGCSGFDRSKIVGPPPHLIAACRQGSGNRGQFWLFPAGEGLIRQTGSQCQLSIAQFLWDQKTSTRNA